MTLVLVPGSKVIRVLWALFSHGDPEMAKRELAERERISEECIEKSIGVWSPEATANDDVANSISHWAINKDLDFVVWTALRPKFKGEYRVPEVEEVIQFLSKLPYEKSKYAQEYIRRAPIQIDTDYRRIIEKELGWPPISSNV